MLPTKFRFIWPSGFGGEDFKKSANQKQELPVVAMFVNRSGQNEQSLERTPHRCFLQSFISFDWEVSEEKIKMRKVNGRRTPSDGKSSHCLWQGELKIHLFSLEYNFGIIYKCMLKNALTYMFSKNILSGISIRGGNRYFYLFKMVPPDFKECCIRYSWKCSNFNTKYCLYIVKYW